MRYSEGDRVEYIGNVAETRGAVAVVRSVGDDGRYVVDFPFAPGLDMCGSVLRAATNEGNEEMAAKARKTIVTHPDGTVSTRTSRSAIYTYAVEQIKDMRAYAAGERAEGVKVRAERERFIAAVRAGKVAKRVGHPGLGATDHYLIGEGGEEWWLGHEGGRNNIAPVDRKASIRKTLADLAKRADGYDLRAEDAEVGPEFTYAVLRWSANYDNASRALSTWADWPYITVRVVPAEAAE